MTFASILFQDAALRAADERVGIPDFFRDLCLDQVVAAVTADKEEYNLVPFMLEPLHDADAVAFRHEVMHDIEHSDVFELITSFALGMREVRRALGETQKRYYERQKERWFVDAVELYGDAVCRLSADLSTANMSSRGLLAFRAYIARYAASEPFVSLLAEAKRLTKELSAIRYNIFVKGLRVAVRRYAHEADYSAEVEAAFARFRQGEATEYDFRFSDWPEMNHIEAQILEGVAHLHRETFTSLTNYWSVHSDFLDDTVVRFDREIQFYIAYLEHIAPLKAAGLAFCYPEISQCRDDVYDYQGFDLALAAKLIATQAVPVCNDFHLKGPERVIVVSGPNQGGKTTFARVFGQLHYLASLGLPIPGMRAQLCLPDQIFTHFERQEQMTNLRGKLEDDLVRIHDIIERATPQSIIVINEIFASTSLRDAVLLGKRIAAALMDLDLLCVWVTFIDELASLGKKTVSMVSTVVPDNPSERTFKIVRRPADGLAYALSIAEKHRLTYEKIKERIPS
jgi:DNA mismatch repair protein MutS